MIAVQRAQHQNRAILQFELSALSKVELSITDPKVLSSIMINLADDSVHRYNPISYKYIWDVVLRS